MEKRRFLIINLFILLTGCNAIGETAWASQNPSPSHTVIPSESKIANQKKRAPQQNQIEEGPKGVSLQFNNIPLMQVLEIISQRSGLQFELNPNLHSLPVNADILAPDWWKAVGLLLGELSRTEVWTGNLKTSKVYIYQSTAYKDTLNSVRRVRKMALSNQKKRNQGLESSPPPNLKSSTKATLTILPPHVLFDPGLLIYLKKVGIQLPVEYEMQYEPVLKGLQPDHPISPATLNDPSFADFLKYLERNHVPLPEQLSTLK